MLDMIVYRCDPEKNATCRKTACGKECNFTTQPEYSADGIKYRYNEDTSDYERMDARQ